MKYHLFLLLLAFLPLSAKSVTVGEVYNYTLFDYNYDPSYVQPDHMTIQGHTPIRNQFEAFWSALTVSEGETIQVTVNQTKFVYTPPQIVLFDHESSESSVFGVPYAHQPAENAILVIENLQSSEKATILDGYDHFGFCIDTLTFANVIPLLPGFSLVEADSKIGYIFLEEGQIFGQDGSTSYKNEKEVLYYKDSGMLASVEFDRLDNTGTTVFHWFLSTEQQETSTTRVQIAFPSVVLLFVATFPLSILHRHNHVHLQKVKNIE